MCLDPDHWWHRAAEARSHARAITDPERQAHMLDIARGYERLANIAVLQEGIVPGRVQRQLRKE